MALVALWTTSIGQGKQTKAVNSASQILVAIRVVFVFEEVFASAFQSGRLGNRLHWRGGDSSSAPPAPNLSGFGWGHQILKQIQGVYWYTTMSSCHPLSCSAFFIAAEDGQAFLHLKEWIAGVEKVIEQKTQCGMNPGTIQQVVAQVHSNSPKKVAGLGCGLIKKWTTRAPISAKNRCKKQKSQTSQENSMTLWQKVSKVSLCLPWADIEPHSSVSQVFFSWLKASQKAGTQGYPTQHPCGRSQQEMLRSGSDHTLFCWLRLKAFLAPSHSNSDLSAPPHTLDRAPFRPAHPNTRFCG